MTSTQSIGVANAFINTNDIEASLAFYRDVLGFSVHTDVTHEGFRWASVSTPRQPNLEIVLDQIGSGAMPMTDADHAALVDLLAKGLLTPMIFDCDDVDAVFESVRAAGRGRAAGARRPVLRRPRLCFPRPGRQHAPVQVRPAAGLSRVPARMGGGSPDRPAAGSHRRSAPARRPSLHQATSQGDDQTMSTEKNDGFTADERAAMKDRAAELKADKSRGANKKVKDLEDLLAKIAEMPQPDRGLAERIHVIVSENAPELDPKTWYGMPAYARDGKPLVFFQPAAKFGARYATLGFQDIAKLDDGAVWPVAWALTTIDEAEAEKIAELV